MGRLPFYAYPSFPYSSYASPAEASFHRPFSPAPRSAPTSRSVINIPVYDSTPPQPSSSPSAQPLPAAVPLIDPSSAATTIQSHFRGYFVRRHQPLLHLRTIARARKQLEELQSELERPEFSLKVRENEKERLCLSESIMAIILRLDAIEGSMAEVRSQRKEATRMAIKLQEAMDAIMIQKDEIAAINPTAEEGDMMPGDDPVLTEKPQEPLHPEIDMVDMVPANGTTDVNTLQEKHLFSEDSAAGNGGMDSDMVDVGQQRECGLGCVETIPQVQHVKAMYTAEQDMSHSIGENAGSDATHGVTVSTHAAEEVVGNAIDALHLETQESHMQKVDQDSRGDDVIDAGDCYTERDSTDGAFTCGMHVVQQARSQNVDICPGTPTAEEKCDHPHCYTDVAHGNESQGPSAGLGMSTLKGKCSPDGDSTLPMLQRHGYEEHNNAQAHEEKSSDGIKLNNVSVHQLSKDCRQLKSLVGQLLVQNKAQSNILGALAERLEMLEHQQLNCQHNQQRMCEKRKSKKSVKRRSCEEC